MFRNVTAAAASARVVLALDFDSFVKKRCRLTMIGLFSFSFFLPFVDQR